MLVNDRLCHVRHVTVNDVICSQDIELLLLLDCTMYQGNFHTSSPEANKSFRGCFECTDWTVLVVTPSQPTSASVGTL